MRRVAAALLACLVAGPVLAGCAGEQSSGLRAEKQSVDVDTPALRTLKARAGIEPCRTGGGDTRVGDGMPEISLPCLGGGHTVDLSRLRGPMVVNLFAQWCGPCRQELPFYQTLHAKAKAKGTLAVLGVDYLDPRPSEALRLAASSGVTYPLAADPAGRLRTDLRVRGLPGLVLLDKRGKVVDVEYRAFRSYAELRALVQRRLDVRLPA